MSTNIEQLKVLSNRLSKLLEDPQPGLFTWQKAIHFVLSEISALTADNLSCKGCKAMSEDCYSCIRGERTDRFTTE